MYSPFPSLISPDLLGCLLHFVSASPHDKTQTIYCKRSSNLSITSATWTEQICKNKILMSQGYMYDLYVYLHCTCVIVCTSYVVGYGKYSGFSIYIVLVIFCDNYSIYLLGLCFIYLHCFYG